MTGKAYGSVNFVPVAPDDSDIVAYADNTTLTVWVSTNGGSTWGSIDTPTNAANFTDMAMSAESAGIHYIAITGRTATSALYARLRRLSFVPFLDLTPIPLLTGLSVGRLGCSIHGCCYGKPITLPWGLIYTHPRVSKLYPCPSDGCRKNCANWYDHRNRVCHGLRIPGWPFCK